ncbi:MAG: hydantoinase B/oxoprolinase family protein [Pseudomonadota bacterium]|nr:hydantoinase B/oxoprolinase family protein [Pseudomonadota bacterium]
MHKQAAKPDPMKPGRKPRDLDPVLMAVMANRLDGIVREMSNTLLRAGRSAVISSARDFSCSIVTADNQLLSSAEGLPGHIFGTQMMTRAMCDLHDDLAEGDAFLHNDPYMGNTHPADHGFLVPVFFEGEHMFTVCSKAHQADIGNSIPTTYFVRAKDVYEEGSLIFPCVRIQRGYETIQDIVRMCRARIRVPEQWYGDFLAGVGSARIGERKLKEFCEKYGKDLVKRFIASWFDYSERCMIHEIRKLPKSRLRNTGAHDPFDPVLPEGLPMSITIDIDPQKGQIDVDLTENSDCVPCGLNLSEASAMSGVLNGIFNCLQPGIPHNSGSFRPVTVKFRENCAIGGPKFPHSCSVSTTNVADRLVNMTQSAFAELGEGYGVAEGGCGLGVGMAVISGHDPRRDRRYVNRLMATTNGGPASPDADGWVSFAIPVIAGLMYRDSVEVDEFKYPIHIKTMRLVPGSGGAGRLRGSPNQEVIYGPRFEELTAVIPCDGQVFPAKGILGGHDGTLGESWKIDSKGERTKLPNITTVTIRPGEWLHGLDTSGGGYGDPSERDPEQVLRDVEELWETPERARVVYGVVLTGNADRGYAVDVAATDKRRAKLRKGITH